MFKARKMLMPAQARCELRPAFLKGHRLRRKLAAREFTGGALSPECFGKRAGSYAPHAACAKSAAVD